MEKTDKYLKMKDSLLTGRFASRCLAGSVIDENPKTESWYNVNCEIEEDIDVHSPWTC